jgi:hypothetical protein
VRWKVPHDPTGEVTLSAGGARLSLMSERFSSIRHTHPSRRVKRLNDETEPV